MIERDPTPFSNDEYEARMSRVIDAMRDANASTLVVTNEANIIYLTGYLGQSAYVPQACILSDDGQLALCLRDMDVGAALHTAWLPEDAIIGYPEALVGGEPPDGYDVIFEMLSRGGNIAVERGGLSVDLAARFEAAIGADRLVDGTGLVDWVRLVKSPAEIGVIEEAASIADCGVEAAGRAIRPGVRECDAAAEIAAALIRGTPACGGHDILNPLMASGTKTGTAHMTWTHAPYKKGMSVNLELGGDRYSYVGAIMRTVSIGEPSDRLRRLHDACVDGLEKSLEAACPGNLCEDVAYAFGAAMAKHGFEKMSRCGYPIGIKWLEPTASLKKGDRTVLRPGMAFHFMLGMWIERDFGCTFSETAVIEEGGARSLAASPREIIVVE